MAIAYRDDAVILHQPGRPPQMPASTSPVLARAKTLVLPKVQFAGATIPEAIEFFRVKSAAIDPQHKKINILLKGISDKTPKVSISLEKVPLSEALLYVAEEADLKFEADERTLVLSPR